MLLMGKKNTPFHRLPALLHRPPAHLPLARPALLLHSPPPPTQPSNSRAKHLGKGVEEAQGKGLVGRCVAAQQVYRRLTHADRLVLPRRAWVWREGRWVVDMQACEGL